MSTSHTLSVLVEDKPGVLARVAALFSRRGFNIESLAVGGTEVPDISRMTIVVTVDEFPLEQVTKQLNKLVNVIKIVEQEGEASVARELLLIKVRADASVRTQVIETVNLFRAKVIDVSPESLTIEPPAPVRSSTHFCGCSSRTASARSCSPASSPSDVVPSRSRPPVSLNTPPQLLKEVGTVAVELFYDDNADLSIIQAARSR